MTHRVLATGLLLLALVPRDVGQTPKDDPVANGQPLSHWLEELPSEDSGRRHKAVRALMTLKEKAAPAVPTVIKLLQVANDQNRPALADLLAEIGPAAKSAIPTLAANSKEGDPTLTYHAARAIGRLDPQAKEFKPAVFEVLRLSQPRAGISMLNEAFLAAFPKEITPWVLEWLGHNDPEIRERSARAILALARSPGQGDSALGKLGPDVVMQAANALVAALADTQSDVRLAAVEALYQVDARLAAKQAAPLVVELLIAQRIDGYRAALWLKDCQAEGVPLLIQALDHQDVNVQHRAAAALARLPEQAVPALLEALASQAWHTRALAALTLGMTKGAAKAALPALRKALGDDNDEVKLNSAVAVSAIDPAEAASTVPALTTVLRSGDNDQRLRAAQQLGALGAAAKKGAMALLQAIKQEPILAVRLQTATALIAVDPSAGQAAVPVLVDVLATNEVAMRMQAARAAGQLGPVAKETLPGLLEALKEKNPYLRMAAAEALVRVEPRQADTGIAVLCEMLKDKDRKASMMRGYALESLERLGTKAKSAVPVLVEILSHRAAGEDFLADAAATLVQIDAGKGRETGLEFLGTMLASKDIVNREDALDNIAKLGPLARPLVPLLIEVLQDTHAGIRATTARVLGQIGPDAKEAVPALRKQLEDLDPRARTAAAEALKKIGKK